MDVTMPDGTVVKNVPEGMSQAELAGILSRNNIDSIDQNAISTKQPGSSPIPVYGPGFNAEQVSPSPLGISSIPQAYGAGVARGFGDIGSQVRNISTFATPNMFSPEARAKREGIQQDWQQAERQFQQNTQGNELAATLGRATPSALIMGGRTPMQGMLRGMLGGAVSYNPSPAQWGLQTALGAGLGKIASGASKTIGQRATELGMKATPEQMGATIGGGYSRIREALGGLKGNPLSNLTAYQNQAFETAKFNQQQVTKQALSEIGLKGTEFTDESFPMADKHIGSLFKKALEDKTNIMFSAGDINDLLQYTNKSLNSGKVVRNARLVSEAIAKNRLLDVGEYQKLRSRITTEMGASKGTVRHDLGEIINLLDNRASSQLSDDTKQLFEKARRQWKTYSALSSNPNYIRNGMVDSNKLSDFLFRKDRSGYVLKNNPSRLYEMLRVNRQLDGAELINREINKGKLNFRVGVSGGGQPGIGVYEGIKGLIGKPVLGINRLPQRIGKGSVPALGLSAYKQTNPDVGNLDYTWGQ